MKSIEEVCERGFGEILNCMNAGVYVTDVERRIVFWNRTAHEITGHSPEEVVGRRCADNVLAHTDKDGRALCTTDLCPLYRAILLAKPGAAPVVVYALTRAGRRIALSTSVAPVLADDGHVIGGVEVFRDESQNLRDMELARAAQRSMLTTELPQDPRLLFEVQYAPKDLIGGDFYTIERVNDGQYLILLGDATGHGPSAALYTSLIYGLLVQLNHLFGDPAALLNAMAAKAYAAAAGLGYFTAVAATVDAAARTLTYCSAGHHPPLLLLSAGGVQRLDQAKAPVGVLEAPGYANTTARLEPGDRFLAYTDGVTDIPTGPRERLGLAGFTTLAAGVLGQDRGDLGTLFSSIVARCASVEPDDDITLVSCLAR